jgi:hypothetical protein
MTLAITLLFTVTLYNRLTRDTSRSDQLPDQLSGRLHRILRFSRQIDRVLFPDRTHALNSLRLLTTQKQYRDLFQSARVRGPAFRHETVTLLVEAH